MGVNFHGGQSAHTAAINALFFCCWPSSHHSLSCSAVAANTLGLKKSAHPLWFFLSLPKLEKKTLRWMWWELFPSYAWNCISQSGQIKSAAVMGIPQCADTVSQYLIQYILWLYYNSVIYLCLFWLYSLSFKTEKFIYSKRDANINKILGFQRDMC